MEDFFQVSKNLKQNATLLPDWRNNIGERETHYFDKLLYGGKLVSLITIRSNVPGDVQIIRRILRDSMGTSGKIDQDSVGKNDSRKIFAKNFNFVDFN